MAAVQILEGQAIGLFVLAFMLIVNGGNALCKAVTGFGLVRSITAGLVHGLAALLARG